MKALKLVVVLCCCFITANLSAQTISSPKAIEADLLRIFNRVNYYGNHNNEWKAVDSLKMMNRIFAF